jgi:hypothetical protein
LLYAPKKVRKKRGSGVSNMKFYRKHAVYTAVIVGILALLAATVPYLISQFEERRQAAVQENGGDEGRAVSGKEESGSEANETSSLPSPGSASQAKPPEIPMEKADIVLIGTELEGMYLARAAADEGLKVKIIDPREAVGGQLLQGEMLFLDEPRDDQGRSLVQGRVKELFDGYKSGKLRKQSEFAAYFHDKLLMDLPLESGIRIENIETKPGRNGEKAIAALVYRTRDGQTKKIEADYYVDNTDFAALVSKLDATRLPGLETVYGLNHIEFMASGMMMKFKNVDWRKFNNSFNSLTREQINKQFGGGYVNDSYAIGLTGITNKYQPTTDKVHLRGLNALNQRDGEVIINAFLIFDVDPSSEAAIHEAMEIGKNEIPRILEHFRKSLPGWENAELNGFPNYLYIREFNHYETDYVLQVSDVLSGRMFWNNVSIAGYPLDLQGVREVKWGIEMGRPDKYGMPLSSFLLKNYENVIVAGKLVGASAVAYGSARIQPNTSLAAESIGVILGQIHGKKKLKELNEDDMRALHQYLETNYRIKLTGVQGNNKIAGWTEEEIRKLNTGEIVYPAYVNKRKAY